MSEPRSQRFEESMPSVIAPFTHHAGDAARALTGAILRHGEGTWEYYSNDSAEPTFAVEVVDALLVDLERPGRRSLLHRALLTEALLKPKELERLERRGLELQRCPGILCLEEGKLDPVIGRDQEIHEVIKVLARRGKNNPVLIGEPGVGKTAVAEGLAQLILTEKAPDFLDGQLIMALDLGSILAGTKYRGEFEERLKRIVEEAQNDAAVILVIDEIHTLVGAGAAEGAVDAANILKPALARGKFRCIGATTIDEYRKYIERDPALERRFQPVQVDEPSVAVTIDILRGLRSKFEQHHTLTYHDKAVEQAAILADKFVADRFLPDKAIDVLDEAGSRVRLENRRLPLGMKRLLKELQDTLRDKEESIKEHDFDIAKQLVDHEMEVRTHITIMKQAALTNEALGLTRKEVDTVLENDVAAVIAGWTGVPVTKISDSESKRLLKMEDTLHERLIGQHHAIVSVSKAIRRARVGLRNPDRPIASFIFAGPTGVGKTELTKALSEYMFSSEESMIRLDMSEYMEKHTVAKLIGSPPGYVGYNEGGQLTEAVRTKPYSVVLFDEVEKAHPDVFNLLLQILDDGRLSDSKGRVIDFKNTSNEQSKLDKQWDANTRRCAYAHEHEYDAVSPRPNANAKHASHAATRLDAAASSVATRLDVTASSPASSGRDSATLPVPQAGYHSCQEGCQKRWCPV